MRKKYFTAEEKRLAHNKNSLRFYRANRAKMLLKQKEQWKKHHSKRQKYRILNRERARVVQKQWASNNVEKILKKQRKWRAKNPEKLKIYEQRRKKTPARRAQQNAYRKIWRTTNRDRERQYYHKRRTRIKHTGHITAAQLAKQRQKQKGLCFYCLLPTTKFHVDHKTPLSMGGKNTARNIVMACPNCNLSKGKMKASEFMNIIWS